MSIFRYLKSGGEKDNFDFFRPRIEIKNFIYLKRIMLKKGGPFQEGPPLALFLERESGAEAEDAGIENADCLPIIASGKQVLFLQGNVVVGNIKSIN